MGASLPSAASLTSALLTAADLGGGLTKIPADNTPSTDTGCTDLDPIAENGYIKHSGQRETEAQFTSSTHDGVVSEVLVAESPSQEAADYAQVSRGMRDCTTVLDMSDGVMTELTLTPISFGTGVASVRIAGSNSRVGSVTEYTALTTIKPGVLLSFNYAEVTTASSQLAFTYFQRAVAVADAHLGGHNPNTPGAVGGSGGSSVSGSASGGPVA